MDTLENIRQKRLQFFSKYIVNRAESFECRENENESARNNQIMFKIDEKKENFSQQNAPTTDVDQDKNSADILYKIFKADIAPNHPSGKLNQSVSLDETKHTFNNHKLEEFKNIVESSYQNHVLNKSDNDLQLSRRFSVQSTHSFQAWNFSVDSVEEGFKNSSIDLFSNEKNNGIEMAQKDAMNNSVLNCKIPYMSAYNIYEETEKKIQNPVVGKIFDCLTQTKKLTSNGSSATTSPTSLSSAESIKNVNEVTIEEMVPHKIQLKPPETPKTSNLTFRKNLVKKSIESSKSSLNQSLDELNLTLGKSNQLASVKKTQVKESLEDFLDLGPKEPEHKVRWNKKRGNLNKNIFNCLDGLTDDSDFVHDHSDEENTLDIFSNDENVHVEEKNNFNLKIDLSQLNTSDEEDNVKFDYEECVKDVNQIPNPLESSFSSSSRQQIKPDIIPNLMLDHIDEDHSVSVAVSLAKSMCKEIDYKQEMEAIICNETNDQKKIDPKKHPLKSTLPNSNRAKTSCENKKQENKEDDILPSSKKTPVLPPPTNSAQSIANNPDKPNLYRRKTVIGSYREKYIDSQEKAKNVPIQSVDLFPNRTDQPDQNNKSKVKKKPSQSRNAVWESSILKRPGSASKSFAAKSVRNSNRPISAGLLTYSKLIEIESNIQNENKNQTLNNESDENVKWNENEKNEFLSYKTDWLNLPDEIWLRVLRFLKQNDLAKFGQTCKTFNYLYKDNSLWRKIELKYEYNVKDEWLDWIGKRRPNELNIVQCSGHVSLNGITGMFKNIGQNLQILNLSRCSSGSLSGDNFALQASIRCPNVTSLDLSWTLLSNQTLKLIVDSFKKIESINLSGCNMIQEDGFNQLLIKHGNSLKNLEIAGCIHFSSDVIFNIGCYCRGIEKLNISNCHRIKNESIIEACPQWLKLKYIDLRGIKNIKNNCISNLVRKCPHLEGLSLGECVHVGDASVVEIATYRSDIKQLDLCNCKKISDASIRSMAGICSKLEFLNLKGTNLTDSGLITLSDSSFIKKIDELNLSFLPISEFVLAKILKNAESLKKIHLYGCYNIKHLDDIKQSIGINDGKHLEINI